MSSSIFIDAEDLEGIILKCACPNKCGSMADMIIMRTAHEGIFDHIEVLCDNCESAWNTSLIYMNSL
jgi:hypothetical protein